MRRAPCNTEAERAVLGGILLSPEVFYELQAGGLDESTFHVEAHQHIWRHLGKLMEERGTADPLMLADALQDACLFRGEFNRGYVAQLMDEIPSVGMVAHYAQIVRDDAGWRALGRFVGEVQKAIAEGTDLTDTVSRLQEKLRDLESPEKRTTEQGIVIANRIVEELQTRDGEVDLLWTGLEPLDRLLCGVEPDQLIILGGPASSGKTALALQLSRQWANDGLSVGWLSIEMSEAKLIRRILADTAGVDMGMFKSPRPDEKKLEQVADAALRAYQHRIWIDDRSDVTEANVTARARRLHAQHGCRIVVVDHLHLIRPTHSEERRLAVDHITESLKLLAKDLHLRVVLLSQLSRAGEFKESQGIDANADIAIKLERDVAAGRSETTLRIVKNREGACGPCQLFYYPYHFQDHQRSAV